MLCWLSFWPFIVNIWLWLIVKQFDIGQSHTELSLLLNQLDETLHIGKWEQSVSAVSQGAHGLTQFNRKHWPFTKNTALHASNQSVNIYLLTCSNPITLDAHTNWSPRHSSVTFYWCKPIHSHKRLLIYIKDTLMFQFKVRERLTGSENISWHSNVSATAWRHPSQVVA